MIARLEATVVALVLIGLSGCLAPTAEVLGQGATTATTTGGSASQGAQDAGAEDAGGSVDAGALDAGWALDAGALAQPAILCSPGGLDFGLNAVGITSTLNVLCTNVGLNSGNLLIGDASSSGLSIQNGDQAFSATFDQPFPPAGLAPGESTLIDVTYAPSAGGADNDTLVISSNDPAYPKTQIGLAARAKVLPDCEISVQPTRVDLGDIASGVAVIFPLQLINTGEGECLVSAPVFSNFPCPPECDPFSLPGYPPGSSISVIIAVGGTLEIQVPLTLSVPGPWAGEIDFGGGFTPIKVPVTANVL